MKTPEAIWLAFGLIASGLGLVRLLNELKRAPEGYEDETGFHFGRPGGKWRKYVRYVWRVAQSLARWVPRSMRHKGAKMSAPAKSS
jgi:hypothetical protein